MMCQNMGGELQCLETKNAEMGTGAETRRISGPKLRPKGDQEQGKQVCSRCGHSQRWSDVHVVEVVQLLK